MRKPDEQIENQRGCTLKILSVLFVVHLQLEFTVLFDAKSKRLMYYFMMFLWPAPHSLQSFLQCYSPRTCNLNSP